MPGVRGVPLPLLRSAIVDYTAQTGRRVTFEYALMAGVNDDEHHARALVEYARGLLCHVNLIPVNPAAGPFARSSRNVISNFERFLVKAGVETTLRAERGADIDAACGQLKQHTPQEEQPDDR